VALELVRPGAFIQRDPLEEGWVSLGADGSALFNTSDLDVVGIKERAVILIDREGFRVALRAPRSGEDAFAVRVTPLRKGKGGKRVDQRKRRITIAAALRELGIDPKLKAGACRVPGQRVRANHPDSADALGGQAW
jgi:hypothetical protein